MDTSKSPLFITNLLALAGSVIVIAILIWGLVNFTGWSVSKISSIFSRDNSVAQVDNRESQVENDVSGGTNDSPAQTPAPATGTPDFSVQILRTGMTSANEAYVVFDIANHGGASTGTWYFTANVPTSGNSQIYTSPAQVSLAQGAHIENTLRFSPLIGGTFTVTVDPSNRVKELNESNNIASQSISGNNYTQTPAPYPGY